MFLPVERLESKSAFSLDATICQLRDLLFQSPHRGNCLLVCLGRIQECLDKEARASAVKVSVRSVPLLLPCWSRFAMVNFNSLSFRADEIVTWSE